MTTPPSSQSPTPRPVWPSAKQAFVTLVGGLVLAASTCGGALANFNINHDSTAFNVFMVLFLLSLPVVATGILLVIVRLVQVAGRRRAARSARPATPSASLAGAIDEGGTATVPGTAGTNVPTPGAADPFADAGEAWPAVVRATIAGVASVGAFVAMTVLDPNPIALLFLAVGLAAAAASLVYFVIAGVRLLARR
jgi:hypothetical protein